MRSQQLGKLGETFVKNFLEDKGYVFLQANYKTQFGEIDLIMKEAEQVVFVEVKTRKEQNAISGTADLPASKLERLETAALAWAAEQGIESWRMELAEVILLPTGLAKIRICEV